MTSLHAAAGFGFVVPVPVPRMAHLPGRGRRPGDPPESKRPIRTLMTTLVAALALAAPASANHNQFHGHRVGNQAWQWKWEKWLPDKWQRIGACETGYGKRPGRWDWNSGTYQGAFGFAVSSWDQFKPVSWWPSEAYLATPWQQYQTALAIYRRYGLSGWGCRNA